MGRKFNGRPTFMLHPLMPCSVNYVGGGELQSRGAVEGEVLKKDEDEEERHSILLCLVSTLQPTSSCSGRTGAEEPVVAQEQCL